MHGDMEEDNENLNTFTFNPSNAKDAVNLEIVPGTAIQKILKRNINACNVHIHQ